MAVIGFKFLTNLKLWKTWAWAIEERIAVILLDLQTSLGTIRQHINPKSQRIPNISFVLEKVKYPAYYTKVGHNL